MHLGSIQISLIEPKDSYELGNLIRNVLEEMNAPKTGTAYADPYLFDLYTYYNKPKRDYYVIRCNGELLGEVGMEIFPEHRAMSVRFKKCISIKNLEVKE